MLSGSALFLKVSSRVHLLLRSSDDVRSAVSSMKDETVSPDTKVLDGVGIDVAMSDACSADPQQAFEYFKTFGLFDSANSGFALQISCWRFTVFHCLI